jgi:polyribonucleotide nucleotidyltransferase
VKVKVIGFDERGKVKLSMRVVDQASGADITEQVGAKPGRSDRDRDRGDRDRGERRERFDRGDRRERGEQGERREGYEPAPMPQDSEQPVIGE